MKSDPSSTGLVKTPEQVEFTRLVGEFEERFGYDRKTIQKICGNLSAGGISLILSGDRSPSEARLKLLRDEMARLTEPVKVATTEPDVLRDQISELEKECPPRYEAARLAVQALHGAMRAERRKKKASSQDEAGAKEILRLVGNHTESEPRVEGQPARGAGEQQRAAAVSGAKLDSQGRHQKKKKTEVP